MKYYHYTNIRNIKGIDKMHELTDSGSGVYVCDSLDDLQKFVGLYKQAGELKLSETMAIEFETDIEFKESFDHNPDLLGGARAFVHFGNVPIRNIKYNVCMGLSK